MKARWPLSRELENSWRSLPVQMILSFVLLVFLTAAALGLPAIWLIRDGLNRQAWSQVDQGSYTVSALYQARQTEVDSLATLTAQRPTLRRMLLQKEWPALSSYLDTLRTGAILDLMLVCSVEDQTLAQTGTIPPADLCQVRGEAQFYSISAGPDIQVWLLANHEVGADTGQPLGHVVVGLILDEAFMGQMRQQTGLEQTLLIEHRPVVSSLPGGITGSAAHYEPGPGQKNQGLFYLDGRPYYFTRLPLQGPDLVVEAALPVVDITATQERLAWTMAGGILLVVFLGSGLGVLLARRISRPLARLGDAAARLSRGDLDTPVAAETQVREVALLAWTLEGARIDLKLTLNELRQEKAWTDHLLEAVVEGIVTLDRQGRITFFSRGAERITGWSRDQALGRPCGEVFQPLETGESFEGLIPAPDRRSKIPVKLLDGRQVILSVTGARLLPPASSDARVALVFRDVSEEEVIHRLLGHFLANVAHEFRTPLSALAASIELLLDQAPDLTMAELQELLASLHLGVLGLQTLVDNLLESASIEAGRFRVYPRPANLMDIIAEAARTMQPLFDKHGQTLRLELPAALPVVRADPRRVIQVLVNLLSNASKYGPDHAEIVICASAGPEEVRVAVADQGAGISLDQQQSLFRPLVHPAAGSDKAQVGMGLGLSVVKAVIEAHRGRVGVEDCSQGTVFWFTLPVRSEE